MAKSQDKGRRWSGKKIALVAVGCVAAVLLLAVLVGYFYLDSLLNDGSSDKNGPGQIDNSVVDATPQEFQGDVVNFLVCGIDYDAEDDGRDYADGKGMADLIMYVNFDVKNKKMNVLQIPRDSYVGTGYSTGGTCKINATYAHGDDQKNLINNLARVLSEQYGLPVDHYMTIDMDAFNRFLEVLQNSFGGLKMYVPWDVKFTDPKTGKTVTVQQGEQTLDAATATWLLRQRKTYNQGDLKRLELQQYFYAGMFNAFKTMSWKDIAYFMPPFIYYVKTDLNAGDVISLGMSLLQVKGENITMFRAPGGPIDIQNTSTGRNESAFGLNPVNMAEVLNLNFRTYGEQKPTLPNMPWPLVYNLGEIYDKGTQLGSLGKPAAASSSAASPAA